MRKKQKGKRKDKRPLCTQSPMHLVVKCRKRIYDDSKFVREVLMWACAKFGVPAYDFAIGHDHIHFVTKVPSRVAYVRFIRALTGKLARRFGKNLISSVFTRIASWGFDYRTLLVYCQKNREEAFRNTRYPRRPPMYRAKPNPG